jgi:hypothetical protein
MVSMPRNATFRLCARAKLASVDASSLQPVHHEPQTFTKTGLPRNSASVTRVPVKTSRPAIGGFDAAEAAVESAAHTHESTMILLDRVRANTR